MVIMSLLYFCEVFCRAQWLSFRERPRFDAFVMRETIRDLCDTHCLLSAKSSFVFARFLTCSTGVVTLRMGP